MKTINIYLSILLLLIGSLSCKDNFSVDLSDQHFVRLNKTSVSITEGEKYTIKAKVDTLGSANKTFNWTILNPEIASIEAIDNNSAIITGVSEGATVIKIESTDGEIKYFSDLTVAKDRVIKILAIGNSFSEDAVENYLYDLAKAPGHKVLIGNLYFGGRSLETHWERASTDGNDYQLRVISPDGSRNTFNNVSIKQAVEGENWDYISFQEVSQLSGKIEGYQEFLPKLKQFVAPLATNPELKFILHQTWAYAQDSNHDGFRNYGRDQMTMYNAIVDAVWKGKDLAKMDLVVPSGTAIQNGRTTYIGDKFTRDGYHLNLMIGRFTAASAWYEAIFGNVLQNSFVPENFSEYDATLAKTAASEAVKNPKIVTVLEDYKYPEPNEFILSSPLFIDFGEVESGVPFNNFKHPNDIKIGALKDMSGNNTNFSIEVTGKFSGRLSRGLNNVLGLPKTASEDMFFSDGINIPESELRLANLNRNQKYTLVFYGSINDNKTETQFDVRGVNSGTGLLDNDNNLGKLVIIEGIQPAEDASISITLKPGPNNKQWARFFGVNAMVVLPEGGNIPFEPNVFKLNAPVFIDFGVDLSPAPFYSIARSNNDPHFDLPDQNSTNTGIALSFTAGFSGENRSGVFNNTLSLPGTVTQDALWSNKGNPESGLTLYRLNPTMKYQFVFFGSRNNSTDNKETKYEVIGATRGEGAHDASNNGSRVTVIGGIQPTPEGIVDIRLSAGPNNNNVDGFYYLNTMIITPDGYKLPGM